MAQEIQAQIMITFALVMENTTGGRTGTVYMTSKRDSYVVVPQLSLEFTARLLDRWHELEEKAAQPAQPDFSNPVAASRA